MTTTQLDARALGFPPARCLIDGQWVGAHSGALDAIVDPATDQVIAAAPHCGAAETRQAIEAAARALPGWRALSAWDRGARMRAFYQLLLRDLDRLARLITLECGKPLAEARGEVIYGAGFVDWAAEEGKRIYGETIPASVPGKRLLVLHQGVGVTAAITPWNFPIAMITRKLGPALAAGCTQVIKPAPQTPLSALALGALALEAGIPAGVVNVVTGDAQAIGGELLGNPTVRKLSFTDSTAVGQRLMQLASQHVTRLSLELGGHAPFLVFDDADLDAAVAGALASKFRNAGQTCVCANRFIVQAGIYDRFRDAFAAAVSALRVGSGLDPQVQVGPLINDAAVEKVERQVADALRLGGRVVTGGSRVSFEGLAPRFYAPTVIEQASPQMAVMCEETFGPLAPIYRFTEEAEALAVANDTPYGLAAYFYTRDASRLMRVAEALEYGIIGANDGLPSTPQAPFGGLKMSGLGREGGKYVMHEYLETKYVSWGIG